MLKSIAFVYLEYHEKGEVVSLKLSKLKLYNYRCFGDIEQVIDIDDLLEITALEDSSIVGITTAIMKIARDIVESEEI